MIELLKLSKTLNPKNSYKLFSVEDIYLLVDKFYPEDYSDEEKNHLRLFFTPLVSTATTKRAFSAMKIVKTKLHNRMKDNFLANYLIVYIEKKFLKDSQLI